MPRRAITVAVIVTTLVAVAALVAALQAMRNVTGAEAPVTGTIRAGPGIRPWWALVIAVGLTGTVIAVLLRRRSLTWIGLLVAVALLIMGAVMMTEGTRGRRILPDTSAIDNASFLRSTDSKALSRLLETRRSLAPDASVPADLVQRMGEILARRADSDARMSALLAELPPKDRETLAAMMSNGELAALPADIKDALRKALGIPDTPGGLPPEGLLLENGLRLAPSGVTGNVGVDTGGQNAFGDPIPPLLPEGAHSLVDTPVFKLTGAPNTSYLRVAVGDTYDGKTWRLLDAEGWQEYRGELLPLPPEEKVVSPSSVTVTPVSGVISGPAPVAQHTVQLLADVPVQYNPRQGLFFLSAGAARYGFQSIEAYHAPSDLRRAAVTPDPRYVQLPDAVSPRVRALAAQIVAGRATPYDKAVAIETYLRQNYTYDFLYQNAPSDVEATEWFLFTDKRGVCANFNNAFVVLARAAGLPARLVAGWAVNPSAAEQTIDASAAHQWGEVYFDGPGWVTFDATGTSAGPLARIARATGAQGGDALTRPLPPDRTPTTRPVALGTVTEITSQPPRVRKGEKFSISGTVKTAEGKPLPYGQVEVYLNTSKQHGGAVIGGGLVISGKFAVPVQVPDNSPAGAYQVLARTLPGLQHNESWSDPPIQVSTDARLTIESPTEILAGRPFTVIVRLSDAVGDLPIAGRRVTVRAAGTLRTVATDANGRISMSFPSQTRGTVHVEVVFAGTDVLAAAAAEADIPVRSQVSLSMALPATLPVGDTVVASGTVLAVDGGPVAGATAELVVDDKVVAQTQVDNQRRLSIPWKVDALPGQHTVVVRVPAQGGLAAAAASGPRTVTSKTAVVLTTDPPPVAGYPYAVAGKVVDALGRPVSGGGKVTVALPAEAVVDPGEPRSGPTSDNNATFRMTNADKVTVTVGVTANLGDDGSFLVPSRTLSRNALPVSVSYQPTSGYLSASTAQAQLDVMVPTQITADIPDRIGLGEQVVVSGTLRDSGGTGLGGQRIVVSIQVADGEEPVSQTVVADAAGQFTWTFRPSGVGDLTLELKFTGAGLYLPSSVAQPVAVLPVAVAPGTPGVLARGAENTYQGVVTLGGAPSAGENVDIVMNGTALGRAVTDATGRFSLRYTVASGEAVGARSVSYRLPRYGVAVEQPVMLKARAALSVTDAPKDVRAGGKASFSLTLVDDRGEPLQGKVVGVQGWSGTVTTDESGRARFSPRAPKGLAHGDTGVMLAFLGDVETTPADVIVRLEALLPGFPWGRAAAGALALVLAIGVAYVAWARRERLAPALAALGPQKPSAGGAATSWRTLWVRTQLVWKRNGVAVVTTNGAHSNGHKQAAQATAYALEVSLRLECPDLAPPLRDVWGVGDPLRVHVTVTNVHGGPVPGAEVELAAGGTTRRITTDASGVAWTDLVFNQQASIVVAARHGGAEALVKLRVVDYRAEVERLYAGLIDWTRARGTIVSPEHTPRDIQRAVMRKPVNRTALESLVSVFEEAEYSGRSISRDLCGRAVQAYQALISGEGVVR